MDSAQKRRIFRDFMYKGKKMEELLKMSLSEFAELLPSNLRRHIKRGINKYEDNLLKEVEKANNDFELQKIPIKTFERSMVIFPLMVGCTIAPHCGNGFFPIEIRPEMIGMKLKDFVHTRVICRHKKPGLGAGSSSKFTPLK